VEELRHLGPQLAPDQVLATVDEVLTRKPEPHRFWEVRTARVVTAQGYRYLSGVGQTFLSHTKNVAMLETLIAYLQARAGWMPNYQQRRIEGQYVGSGHVEKANDLIVARRQKGRGMQWSLETSDALAALRTLMLNGGWERYWQQRQVLPLVAS
jgi:hypothetical protein